MSTEEPRAGVDYCGFCKASYDKDGQCQCNGHGGGRGTLGTCGYCGNDYGRDFSCGCDGFGHTIGVPRPCDSPICESCESLREAQAWRRMSPEAQAQAMERHPDKGRSAKHPHR